MWVCIWGNDLNELDYALPEFLENTGWQNPKDYVHSWQLGHRTNLGIWEFLNADPERMKVFNSGMRSLATVANSEIEPYPFDKELNAEPIAADEIVRVDVGGGRGQALERIKKDFPALQGRLILQDQPDVIADARAGGLPAYIETHGGTSFFEPNPMKGARAYHFRRIFHEWSDGPSVKILRNTVLAMTNQSRILISDTLVPRQGATRAMALQDLNMMAFAGMERTDEQWHELLQKAGLRLMKIWREEVSMHVVVEARHELLQKAGLRLMKIWREEVSMHVVVEARQEG